MGPATPESSRAAVERVAREEWGRVLAILVADVRDLDLAEDVLQDSVVAALHHWPRDGVPRHPDAWLLQTARRKAVDRFRRDARFRARREQLEHLLRSAENADDAGMDEPVTDRRLCLMFTCCHPAIGKPARVALTLRALGGLTTTEIARAFLVPETTMAQRLVRAKHKIRAANIPYRVPPPELWPERLDSVLSVVYFIFNEGYGATSGPGPTRGDLCEEAIRLGRILVGLAPDEPEVAGLAALMLLHDSRRAARIDADGDLVTLEDQDRSLWNRDKIREGEQLLEAALRARRVGPYQVQAAISAVHANAASHGETDWSEIVRLYGTLHRLQPTPVVRLNEAVARSFAEGPEAGLRVLSEIGSEPALERYLPYQAALADFQRRAGRPAQAAAAYRRAIELAGNAAERAFFERRLRDLGG